MNPSNPPKFRLFDLRPVLELHESSRRVGTFPLCSQPGWEAHWYTTSAANGIWEGAFRARLACGQQACATVGLRLEFPEWSPRVYVLLPGAVYAGNRFPAYETPYPPTMPAALVRKDLPLQTEVPRLRYESGPSCLRQMTSDPAFPGVGLFFPEAQTGLWILTASHNELGLLGIELEESDSRDSAVLNLFSPGMRRAFEYEICCDRIPSKDRARDFVEGDVITIPLSLEEFSCSEPQELFDRIPKVRRRLVSAPVVRHDIPFSQVWTILEAKYHRENWIDPQGYYSIGVEPMRSRHYTQNWQMGWTGGMIIPHSLFLRGSALAAERVLRCYDFVFPQGQAASGYFYACGDGNRFFADSTEVYPNEHRSLVRKNADGLFYMLSTLTVMEARGWHNRIREAWTGGLRRCADAFVSTWEDESEWGHFVDDRTGAVVIPGSTSGALAPAALVLAARRFPQQRAKYLRVAIAAAEHFDRNFLRQGFTNGGPGDAAQCPDSESVAGLLESYVTLFEETLDPRWICAARRAATHLASWTVSYDFPFPSQSTFGKMGMLTNGTVLANAQNKHSAPGICTHSGLSLLRLYRHTGERWIMDLLCDIAHALPQFMSRSDRPIPWTIPYNQPEHPWEKNLRSGWMCERVNLTYWGGHEHPGEVFYYSCWSEVSMLLTIAELPGIYARPETKETWSLDHIEARWEGSRLIARNLTPWPAHFSVLVESAQEASSRPWPSLPGFAEFCLQSDEETCIWPTA